MSETYALVDGADGHPEPLVLTGRWWCAKRAADCPHFAECSLFGCPDTPKRNPDDRHSMREGRPIPFVKRTGSSRA